MITKNNIKTVKGSEIIYETLKKSGVDTVFGYPGGIVLDLYNEFYGRTDIKHVLVRHEQSAVHAAEGYARESGKCGVVLVTSGPGAANTVSGIANAYLDGYPVVVITGQVCKNMLGKNAFQEVNICDIVKSCTKHVFQITSAKEIPRVFSEAFTIANAGKKGPVLIDIVKDVFEEEIPADCSLPSNMQVLTETAGIPEHSDLEKVISCLNSCKRPVIAVGGGVKHAAAEEGLFKLSQEFSIPVVNTMAGLGTFPQDNQNYFGMVGIFGDKSANEILKSADLIITLGARFNDRILCMFSNCDLSSKVIQVDINPDELSNFMKVQTTIQADISAFLSELLEFQNRINNDFSQWRKFAEKFRDENVVRTPKTNLLHTFEVMQEIEKYTQGMDITFTTEVGQHQLWAVQNLSFYKNRKIFVSGGAGTMGFGLPAAIGAAVANSVKDIICIAGDGSFQMSMHELATCKDYDLNIKIMIINNGYLGMVRQLQEKSFNGRYSETKISSPDYVTLAKSYGIHAERVESRTQIHSALQNAFEKRGTCLIDFMVEPMEVL